ncbi:MAG: DUF4411 family protein [Cyclobacteriaceae bacterium]|nr:DUF4411 family protein [Cyclobacteriaceae bacterium]
MKSSNDIFCIDANIFIFIYKNYPESLIKGLWDRFDSLFKDGQLISHHIVYEEICHDKKKPDELAKWLKNKERYFKKISQRQTEFVPDILKNFPKLINPDSTKDQADPWIIAMIMEEKEIIGNQTNNYIIISNESKTSPNKIPAACSYYDIRHLNLVEFFNYNYWEFAVR